MQLGEYHNEAIAVEGMNGGNSPFQEWISSEPWKRFKSIGVTGLKGSSKAYLLSLWRETGTGPLLVIVPSIQKAESLAEDLRFFSAGGNVTSLLFPPWETLPYDEIPPHPEIIRERVKSLHSLMNGEEKVIILSPVRALMQKVLSPADLKRSIFPLQTDEEVGREDLVHFLQENGFASARVVEEPGDFSLRGAIIDIYSPSYREPLRLEFDGDRLSSIRWFDPENQRSLPESGMKSALLLPSRDISKDLFAQPSGSLFDYLRGETVLFIEESDEVEKEAAAFPARSMSTIRRPCRKNGLFYPRAFSTSETRNSLSV